LEQLEDLPEGDSLVWVAITLLDDKEQAIFEAMVLDLLNLLRIQNPSSQSVKGATSHLIDRIKAWQQFMDRDEIGLLSASEEIGLVGELGFLQRMLHLGLDPLIAIVSWKGPFGGNQDFQIGTGAVEVKSSLSGGAFPARISNLAQLDFSQVSPLFLAALRLKQAPEGDTLGDLAAAIFSSLSHSIHLEVRFRLALMKAGYLESHSEKYHRKFVVERCQVFQVDQDFPKLTRENVPLEVVHASYTIDLERISRPHLEIREALHHLGAN